jgi:hypothetical protein
MKELGVYSDKRSGALRILIYEGSKEMVWNQELVLLTVALPSSVSWLRSKMQNFEGIGFNTFYLTEFLLLQKQPGPKYCLPCFATMLFKSRRVCSRESKLTGCAIISLHKLQ